MSTHSPVAAMLFAALAAAVSGASAAEPGITLVEEGQARAVVIIPERKHETRGIAYTSAQTLAEHVERMSGARLEIKGEELLAAEVRDGRIVAKAGTVPEGIHAFVLVGEGTLAGQLGVTGEGLGTSGVRIRTVGNALAVVGSRAKGDARSTQHAVFELLEMLGCRYLWPGPGGKVVPTRTTVAIGPVDHAFTPPIGQRHIRSHGFSNRTAAGLERLGLAEDRWRRGWDAALAGQTVRDWAWWHRLGGDLGIRGGHAFADFWERYGKDHPEWFARQADGTRDQSGTGTRERLCVSSPGLIDAIAGQIIAEVNENPATRSVSLSPNDGGYSSFCMCDACRALDSPDAPRVTLMRFRKAGQAERSGFEYPSLTDRYVWFWNRIAEKVAKAHPKLLMVVDAYSAYRLPPVERTLHANLVVRYVPSTADGWDAWQRRASKIYWRPNILYAGHRDGTLLVCAASLAGTFNHVAARGAIATDFDSILHNWAIHGLNYYAAARLNWRPELTFDAILDDYCTAGFGKGAGAMRRYFLLAQKATDPYAGDRSNPPGLDAETIARLRGLLSDAESDAGDDEAIGGRIAFLRLGLNFSQLQVALDAMAARAKAGEPVDVGRARRLMTLNFLALRDIVQHHHLAVNAAYLVWGTGNYAKWRPLGWTKLHTELLERAAAGQLPAGRLTGREDGLDAMLAAFDL